MFPSIKKTFLILLKSHFVLLWQNIYLLSEASQSWQRERTRRRQKKATAKNMNLDFTSAWEIAHKKVRLLNAAKAANFLNWISRHALRLHEAQLTRSWRWISARFSLFFPHWQGLQLGSLSSELIDCHVTRCSPRCPAPPPAIVFIWTSCWLLARLLLSLSPQFNFISILISLLSCKSREPI